jgi:hypothetical protein
VRLKRHAQQPLEPVKRASYLRAQYLITQEVLLCGLLYCSSSKLLAQLLLSAEHQCSVLDGTKLEHLRSPILYVPHGIMAPQKTYKQVLRRSPRGHPEHGKPVVLRKLDGSRYLTAAEKEHILVPEIARIQASKGCVKLEWVQTCSGF